MKKTILLATALLLTLVSRAGDYGKYYQNLPKPMPEVTAPVIPSNTVSLLDCGGKGDGTSMNTEAFAKAVSKLNKMGGGHLDVPAGIYLTGLISLKDNIDLHLERNAVIVFSEDKKDLFKVEDGKTDNKATPGISASNRKNISITGEGIIDGNGEWWRPVKRSKVSDAEWSQFLEMGGIVKGDIWYPYNLKHFDNVASSPEIQERMRANLVRFSDCENVLLQGITLENSPKFHFTPSRCRNVIVDGIKIHCPWNAQNGDAMDIGNCTNVLIVNNTINAGDDGICMKGGAGTKGVADGPCENINIQDNIVYHAHGGFVIGSEFSGGMKNIYVHNNTFSGTDTGLRFKSSVGRGGITKDIYISNIYMTDIKDQAIVFETTYADKHAGSAVKTLTAADFPPDFTDIHIKDIVCRGCETGIAAHGEPGMIHGITIDNANIFYNKTAKDIDANSDIKMTNVNFVTFAK